MASGRVLACAAVIGLAAAGAVAVMGVSGALQPGTDTRTDSPGEAKQPNVAEMVPGLVKGLKETPGCLGVELAICPPPSGKRVIFAWFKDKASVMAWYKSQVHVAALDAVAPQRDKTRKPMADVPDEGPIMAVASFSPNGALAIELYSPLKGGLRQPGGGFAPEGFTETKAPAPAPAPAPAESPEK